MRSCRQYWGGLTDYLTNIHNNTFLIVSGYLFCYLRYEAKKPAYNSFRLFLKNKAHRLLLPLAFVYFTWVLLFSIIIYKTDLRLIPGNILHGYLDQLWFLMMLFWVFVIGYGIARLAERRRKYGILAVCAVWFLGFKILNAWWEYNYLRIGKACIGILPFYIGFAVRRLSLKHEHHYRFWGAAVLVFLDVAVYLIGKLPVSGFLSKLFVYGCVNLHDYLGAVMFFYLFQWAAGKTAWEENRVFGVLRRNSMPMYMYHVQFISIPIFFLYGLVDTYALVIINFAAALLGSYAVTSLLGRFKTTRKLIGLR